MFGSLKMNFQFVKNYQYDCKLPFQFGLMGISIYALTPSKKRFITTFLNDNLFCHLKHTWEIFC